MTTSYAKKLNLLAGKVFSDYGKARNSGVKRILRLTSMKPWEMVKKDYYAPLEEYKAVNLKLRYLGLYRDEHEDFREEMLRLRELRGKPANKHKAKKEE